MRTAIVARCIAGLGTAWLLNHRRQVDLHERNEYFGGHSMAGLVEFKQPQTSFGSVLTP